MKYVKLSKRLKSIANYVQQGAKIIDVGTDHGFIPAYLAQNHLANFIVATDLRNGPLKRALDTAKEHGVQEKIEFILTDGLHGIDGKDIDTVIIAGMGGETIYSILEEAPWIKDVKPRIILQPQSKIDILSIWLHKSGFCIADASLVSEDGKIYLIMLVGVTDQKQFVSYAEACIDRKLLEKHDPLLPEYLNQLIHKTEQALRGMKLAKAIDDDTEVIQLEQALKDFYQMKGETDIW